MVEASGKIALQMVTLQALARAGESSLSKHRKAQRRPDWRASSRSRAATRKWEEATPRDLFLRRGRATETATVLFTDLVSSTELMADVGDAAFDELREDHFAGLRQVLANCAGKEVKTTGDGLLATFPSAVDALVAAVAAHQATDRHAHTARMPLAIRVGLSVGEVAFQGSDVFGRPVVEAARLVAAARPGHILATTVVRAVAGSRAAVDFIEVGPLTLKGFRERFPFARCRGSHFRRHLRAPSVLLRGAERMLVGRLIAC
jgi:class 3 adenylate cyclase